MKLKISICLALDKCEYLESQNGALTSKIESLLTKVNCLKQSLDEYRSFMTDVLNKYSKKVKNVKKNLKRNKEESFTNRYNLSQDFIRSRSKGSMLRSNHKMDTDAKKVTSASDLWQTVMLLTHGIETSVKAVGEIRDISNITVRDYDLKNTFEISHPSLAVNNHKPTFTDYCPMIFTLLRTLCLPALKNLRFAPNINKPASELYLKSVGPDSLGNLIRGPQFFSGFKTKGKSGSFFFFSHDQNFLIKSIREDEFKAGIKDKFLKGLIKRKLGVENGVGVGQERGSFLTR